MSSLDSDCNIIESKENGHAPSVKQIQNEDIKVKKRVNIYTEEPDETTNLRRCSETSDPAGDRSYASSTTEKCLTMTGTIKRGKKAGQNLDVRINISREELEMLDATMAAKKQQSCLSCGIREGPHIVVWSLLCFPFITILSAVYSFYVGTLMWYNVFTYVTEETSILWRILLSPILILSYPFLILICTIGLGLYGGVIQISWFLNSWSKEVSDWEKGFYGWFCSLLRLSDCSPYEVVVLTDVQQMSIETKVQGSLASQDSIPI